MYNNDRISAAFALAARVHAQQVRTFTAIPYISHPMAVAAQVVLGAAMRISLLPHCCTMLSRMAERSTKPSSIKTSETKF